MRPPLCAQSIRDSLTRRAVLVAGLTTAVAGAVAIDAIQLPSLDTIGIFATMLPSGLLAAVAVWLALKVKHTVGAAVATVGLCVLAGLVNSPASFLLTSVIGHGEEMGGILGILGGTLLAATMGAFFAVPLGLLFGLAFAGPVAYVHWLRARPSVDGPDRAAVVLSALSLAISSFAWVVTTGVFHENPVTGLGPELAAPAALPLALVATSALALVVFTARLLLRKRWIARVQRGRVRGWAIIAASEIDTPLDEVLPLTPSSSTRASAVLVELYAVGDDGAYRTREVRRVHALLPTSSGWSAGSR